MSQKRREYRLSRLDDGRWKCWNKDLKKSWVEADTPTEAVYKCDLMLNDYFGFLDHNYGRCKPEDCQHCKEGKQRGLWEQLEVKK